MKQIILFSALLVVVSVSSIFAQAYQPDLNGDKFVNFSDFTMLAANWHKSGGNLTGDINSDGKVDIADLARLADKWLQYSLVIFVNANATHSGDGSSWSNAFVYLQDAIKAASKGSQIWAAQGVYKPDANSVFPGGTGLRTSTFQIPQGVEIYGGFPAGGIWEHRNPVTCPTILSGDICTAGVRSDNCYNVVVGANDVTLDGFIIADGNATATGASARGGGMRNEDANNVTIANCVFRDNFAKYDGGAIYNYKSSISFVNCIFSDNNSGDNGAGVYNSNSDAALTDCRFINNHCGNKGGGIYNYQSPSELINCLFSGNHADSNGGAVYNGYKVVKLINCTIAGNSADGDTGGIYNAYSSSIITNCIVWDNSVEIYNHHSSPHISYSDVKGCGASGANWNANYGSDDGNNIGSDPCFASVPALKAASPCINAGENSALPPDIQTDINGNARFNGIVDMGAYEY
jgi:predicted outer membrane repeat protein